MNTAAVAAALRMLADAIDAPGPAASRFYTKDDPPPRTSWRAARERALRLGIPTQRSGRDVAIDRSAWDRSLTPATRDRAAIEDADAKALAAMGVELSGGFR